MQNTNTSLAKSCIFQYEGRYNRHLLISPCNRKRNQFFSLAVLYHAAAVLPRRSAPCTKTPSACWAWINLSRTCCKSKKSKWGSSERRQRQHETQPRGLYRHHATLLPPHRPRHPRRPEVGRDLHAAGGHKKTGTAKQPPLEKLLEYNLFKPPMISIEKIRTYILAKQFV